MTMMKQIFVWLIEDINLIEGKNMARFRNPRDYEDLGIAGIKNKKKLSVFEFIINQQQQQQKNLEKNDGDRVGKTKTKRASVLGNISKKKHRVYRNT